LLVAVSDAATSPADATSGNDSLVSIDTPIVASHNRLLDEQSAVVRERAIPWEGYQKAGLITEVELQLIRQFEKTPTENLKDSGEKYVQLFLELLKKLVRNDTLQNILVLLEDKLFVSDEALVPFYAIARVDSDAVYGPFI
ncbi:H(+)-transporting V1 sector ATPase subunit H, partial [Cladochytrium tenue]